MSLKPHIFPNSIKYFYRKFGKYLGLAVFEKSELDFLVSQSNHEFLYEQRPDSFFTTFKKLQKNFPLIRTIIDIGASDGCWTKSCRRFFPSQEYLLIEAQPIHAEALNLLAKNDSKIHICLAAASDRDGKINFHAEAAKGGIARDQEFATDNICVPRTTVDTEILNRRLNGPYLLKFDVHGYEHPILLGCERTLLFTEIIIMECYNFVIADECQLFFEMCGKLYQKGFRPLYLMDIMNREGDGVFWQVDIVFAKKSSSCFEKQFYF